MVAVFIAHAPVVEIEDGLVHLTWANGQDTYWKPSTFRQFVEFGRRELDAFDRQGAIVIPFKLDY